MGFNVSFMNGALKIRDGKYYVSSDLAAQVIGVTTQTLIRWRKQPNPPPFHSQYGYELLGLGEWIRKEQIYKTGKGGGNNYPWLPDFDRYPEEVLPFPKEPKRLPGVTMPVTGAPEKPEDRLRRLRADNLEIDLMEKTGQLVLADDVELAIAGMLSRVKMRLLAIPTALSPQITGVTDTVEIQKQLKQNIEIALEELSTDWSTENEGLG